MKHFQRFGSGVVAVILGAILSSSVSAAPCVSEYALESKPTARIASAQSDIRKCVDSGLITSAAAAPILADLASLNQSVGDVKRHQNGTLNAASETHLNSQIDAIVKPILLPTTQNPQ